MHGGGYVGRRFIAARASSPEAGARCGSPARRDLCGGRRATAVPSATPAGIPRPRWEANGNIYNLAYNYADGDGVGNDVALIVAPEPATLPLLALAGTGLLARRRRRARAG
jgi:hypothetical protein